MELANISYQGPPIDNFDLLRFLPDDYRKLLEQVNGFIQFGGGLHIRGVCVSPAWHSVSTTWNGEFAFHKHYPILNSQDVPFGQDALGDQYILRDGIVYRLSGETGELESLNCDLFTFLDLAQTNPIEYLGLEPLIQYQNEGGSLNPGQLLSAYPPFCTKEAASGVSLKAIPALERIAFLAEFARKISQFSNQRIVNERKN